MLPIVIAMLLAQPQGCAGNAKTSIATAQARADAFDLAGAADAFAAAAAAGCSDARLSAVYLRALVAAREAYRFGGSPESIAPVERALAELDREPLRSAGETQVVRFVLQAAIAAAQSEREEVALLIEHAIDLETQRRSAGLSGAPVITAMEMAGDLWLQVHRYDDARRAYRRAADRVGRTPRVVLGLARTAARLSDGATACMEYRAFVTGWTSTGQPPQEIVEARTFLREPICRSPRPTTP
jgi:hypothetical protein